MFTTYDQEVRPNCRYGVKVYDDMGKYRRIVSGTALFRLLHTDADVESWHIPSCACGRGAELPDWAK